MSKRKRALSSSDRDGDTLALTRDNLRRLQESLSPPPLSPNMSRQQSPTRTKNNLDARAKLEAYRIFVDTGREYPPALAHFVKTIIRRPREADTAPSPNAKNIVKMRRWAAGQNERTAISKVAPYLLFVGEADCDFHVPSTPHITAKHDIGLNKFFLPPAPTPQIAKTWGALSSAQPDSCLGYVTTGDARNTGTKAPFSTDDEAILHTFSLTPYMHFPFLTAQWKVPNSNENLHSAQNQAARDGAAVVNQLHDLYTTADSTPPSPVQTCHFSVQTDLQHGGLWVHWRDGHNHYMELEFDFSMRDEVALGNLRGFLRNILDNATGPRLESLKTALPNFIDSQTRGDYPVVLPAGEDDSARSESAASLPRPLSGSQFQFKPPPTPSSTTSDPQKSRKRARHGSIT
jgi:hypothetical protein